jgi:hypothetical protein
MRQVHFTEAQIIRAINEREVGLLADLRERCSIRQYGLRTAVASKIRNNCIHFGKVSTIQ